MSRTRRVKGRSRKRRSRRNRKSPAGILLFIALAMVTVAAWYLDYIPDLAGPAAPAMVAIDGEAVLHFIDAGQSDATLIVTDAGTMLIDAGSRSAGPGVVEYIRNLGIRELTYVVATHPHEDHIGGMDLVLNQFDIGMVLMPEVTHTTRTFERMIDAIEDNNIPVRAPAADSTIQLGGAIFTVIGPNNSGHANLNNMSLSLRMAFGATSFIFTGDAERIAELEMIAAGHYLRSDVLHVGHHGSSTSTVQEFLDAVVPSIAVIAVGKGNRYGHPHEDVMERLVAAGLRIYRSDYHGDIVMTTNGTDIQVRTAR
ncbi:MAG: MBL fold metallo-hydrolase [Defluviitaleaceae bacterium]|nr:MBL fold metallo-hydrolase [Defluviitaleaceae bacterium]